VVREARALGAPWHITARMLGNVAVDGVVGPRACRGRRLRRHVPRQNVRNVRMLKRWLDKQQANKKTLPGRISGSALFDI